MTVDLFAASFICRDADLDMVLNRVRPAAVDRIWVALRALVEAVLRRR